MARWFIIAILLLVACGAEVPEPAQPLTEQEAQGQTVFIQQCNACHSLVNPEGGVGPSMVGIATTAQTRVAEQDAATYLRLSMTQPADYLVPEYDNVMPVRNLSDEEIEAVVAYLLTLQ